MVGLDLLSIVNSSLSGVECVVQHSQNCVLVSLCFFRFMLFFILFADLDFVELY